MTSGDRNTPGGMTSTRVDPSEAGYGAGMTDNTPYTLSTEVHGEFDQVVLDVREALADQGFGVLTEIDLSGTLKAKIDADVPRQVILGACRPQLAYEAISEDPSVAALLPCNVVVRQRQAGDVVVEAFDPQAMVRLGGDVSEAVQRVAKDAAERLNLVLAALKD